MSNQTLRSTIQFDRRQRGFSRAGFVVVVILTLVLVALLYVYSSDPRESSGTSTFAAEFWAPTSAKIERGRYLALAGNCASCHTVSDDGFMAGGVAFETPFGKIFSTNITPDSETGIGRWTGEQFLDSMRYGIRPDGEHLYPAFPYTAFTNVVDEDIAALYVYLKSLAPIQQAAVENEMSFPFNQRSLMSFWNALFFNSGVYETNADESEIWNRGAYLVDGLAHCSACHSPRNFMGAEKNDAYMAGGRFTDRVRDGSFHPWSAPNLTAASDALGAWPIGELNAYLKHGKNSYVDLFGPMNEVVQNSTRFLSDEDINAMGVYLKSLPATMAQAAVTADRRVMGMGRTVYNLHCGTCHLPTGLGDEEQGPRLAGGSLVVQAADPASLINVILYGPEIPHPPLDTKRRKPMEEFQYELTDAEVAAVATYLRSSWGNVGGLVSAEQVAAQR
ncbi:MAG: cytochrome c [Woeseiales bacterium]|jgi:mono/diheme cytochrome c family protein